MTHPTPDDYTLPHYVEVEVDEVALQRRHTCRVCGSTALGQAPALPCPGPKTPAGGHAPDAVSTTRPASVDREGCHPSRAQVSPDDYTRCIGCGADFYPPNGTELCPLCCPDEVHAATMHGDRVVCVCGDFNCASLDYTACSFALSRGRYCKGDVRFPATHATECPGYAAPKSASPSAPPPSRE